MINYANKFLNNLFIVYHYQFPQKKKNLTKAKLKPSIFDMF